jgi:hypothetical protein
MNLLRDTDKVLQMFFDECFAAGPETCGFYLPSSSRIKERYQNLLESVRLYPVPVVTSTTDGTDFGIVDLAIVRLAVLDALYSPIPGFRTLGHALANLESGNGELFLSMARSYEFTCGREYPGYIRNTGEGTPSIWCSDGYPVNDTPADFQRYFDKLSTVSSFADIYTESRMRCVYVERPDPLLGSNRR